MQVTFTYHDREAGDFNVDAEVNGNRVILVTVTDDYGYDVDLEDFSDVERSLMRGLALKEYHNIMNNDDDDSVFDDEDGEDAQV